MTITGLLQYNPMLDGHHTSAVEQQVVHPKSWPLVSLNICINGVNL